jgi:hypothetical protein
MLARPFFSSLFSLPFFSLRGFFLYLGVLHLPVKKEKKKEEKNLPPNSATLFWGVRFLPRVFGPRRSKKFRAANPQRPTRQATKARMTASMVRPAACLAAVLLFAAFSTANAASMSSLQSSLRKEVAKRTGSLGRRAGASLSRQCAVFTCAGMQSGSACFNIAQPDWTTSMIPTDGIARMLWA